MLDINTSETTLQLECQPPNAQATQLFVERVMHHSTLQELTIRAAHLNSENTKIIVDALKAHPSLVSLDLSYNHIGGEGAKSVIELIKKNKVLRKLNIGFNEFSFEELRELCEAVQVNTTLEYLILDKAVFDEKSTRALGEMIKWNQGLIYFQLLYGNLSQEAVISVAEGLRRNSRLRGVNLQENSITEESVQLLVSVLKENKGLMHVSLGGNHLWNVDNRINDRVAQQYLEVVEANFRMREFNLGSVSEITSNTLARIQSALKRNEKYYIALLGILIKARSDATEDKTFLRWLPKELLTLILQKIYPDITLQKVQRFTHALFFKQIPVNERVTSSEQSLLLQKKPALNQ